MTDFALNIPLEGYEIPELRDWGDQPSGVERQ
jgi:hypothetical protein